MGCAAGRTIDLEFYISPDSISETHGRLNFNRNIAGDATTTLQHRFPLAPNIYVRRPRNAAIRAQGVQCE